MTWYQVSHWWIIYSHSFATDAYPDKKLHGAWSPITNTCVVPNATARTLNIIVSLCTDIVMLLIMLVGLFNWRLKTGEVSSLSSLLWTQVRVVVHSWWLWFTSEILFTRVLLGCYLPPLATSRQWYVWRFSWFSSFLSSPSQVFISLDLNGRFLSLHSMKHGCWSNRILVEISGPLNLVRHVFSAR